MEKVCYFSDLESGSYTDMFNGTVVLLCEGDPEGGGLKVLTSVVLLCEEDLREEH